MEQRGGLEIVLLPLLCCGGPLVLALAVASAPALLAWLGANAALLLLPVLGGAGLVAVVLRRRRGCAGTACAQEAAGDERVA